MNQRMLQEENKNQRETLVVIRDATRREIREELGENALNVLMAVSEINKNNFMNYLNKRPERTEKSPENIFNELKNKNMDIQEVKKQLEILVEHGHLEKKENIYQFSTKDEGEIKTIIGEKKDEKPSFWSYGRDQ